MTSSPSTPTRLNGFTTPPNLSPAAAAAAQAAADLSTPPPSPPPSPPQMHGQGQPVPPATPVHPPRPPRAKQVLLFEPKEQCVRKELEFPDPEASSPLAAGATTAATTAGSKRGREDSGVEFDELHSDCAAIWEIVWAHLGDKATEKSCLEVIRALLGENTIDQDLDSIVLELSKCDVGGAEGLRLTDLLARLLVSEPNDSPVKRRCME